MRTRVARAVEIATPDLDENAPPCLRENGRALRPQHSYWPKNNRPLRAQADETCASHSFSRFLPGQDRHPALSVPRRGNVFDLGRSIRRQSDIGEKSRAP